MLLQNGGIVVFTCKFLEHLIGWRVEAKKSQ